MKTKYEYFFLQGFIVWMQKSVGLQLSFIQDPKDSNCSIEEPQFHPNWETNVSDNGHENQCQDIISYFC